MKLSVLFPLALAAIASAAPFFGAKSYQVKDPNTNAFAKPSTSKDSADAYFSTSSVTGSISIDNTNTIDVLLTGLQPNRNIAIALTNATDFSHVKTSTKCYYDSSTPLSVFVVDVPVNKIGIADAEIAIPYKGTDLVAQLKGLGVVILQDRQLCPGGVIIAGAPIEVTNGSDSTSGKATKADDITLQQFLDSKAGTQSGASVAMNKPSILVESHFYSKITGSIKIDASGNVIASLYGLPPNRLVSVAITALGHSDYKTSVVCDYDHSNPDNFELVQFISDKDGRVDGVQSYKTHGSKYVQDVEPKDLVGHDFVLYHDQEFCPGGIPMASAIVTKA
ncbi:UNVERIFIED_CONTAM: hypothetical protein HDU68_009770 [Siphonaria sp. JEL0065]|nr:hypothetical protein HDU68_009770 [Siphonaria sp. JEL0065]